MKPKMTVAVRRGLKAIAALAGADVDADRCMPCPQFTGRRLRDIDSALRWVSALDELPRSRTCPSQRGAADREDGARERAPRAIADMSL